MSVKPVGPLPTPVVVDIPSRVMTAVKTEAGRPDIRRFDVTAINDAIQKNMDILEEGETIAGIAHVDLQGGKIAIVGKVPGSPPVIGGKVNWTVYGFKEWEGDWGTGAALRWSR